MKNSVIFAALLLLLWGCKDRETDYKVLPIADVEIATIQQHPGQKLLEQYCYACHNPAASMNEMIAPPMAAIKAHYLMNGFSKKEFIAQISSYVKAPSEEASLLPGAVARFGLMPKQEFSEAAVEKIAEYIYEYQIEEPEWFAEHWKAGPGGGRKQAEKSGVGGKTYEERGMEIAMAAQQHLGQQLMKQLREHPTLEVLQYCNTNAIRLTNEVAAREGASVQRVSDKNRNPLNAASKEEKRLINQFRRDMAWGHEPEPVLLDEGDSVRFYYPLVTNNLCLQCHGRTTDIQPAVQEKILQLYPNDKAVGYSENQVRGLWKIGIPKQQ